MRVKFFPYLTASFFVLTACGSSTENKAGAEQPTEYGGEQSGAESEGNGSGSGGDDATGNSSVANADVKDIPLMKACYKADAFICAIEATIVSETNLVRGAGRKAVVHDFESSFVARNWSEQQANAGNISHDGFPYDRKSVLKVEFPNATWSFYAENVAMFSGRETDAVVIGKKFVDMWKNSDGHLKNMLSNNNYLGAGVYRVGNAFYATQIFH